MLTNVKVLYNTGLVLRYSKTKVGDTTVSFAVKKKKPVLFVNTVTVNTVTFLVVTVLTGLVTELTADISILIFAPKMP